MMVTRSESRRLFLGELRSYEDSERMSMTFRHDSTLRRTVDRRQFVIASRVGLKIRKYVTKDIA